MYTQAGSNADSKLHMQSSVKQWKDLTKSRRRGEKKKYSMSMLFKGQILLYSSTCSFRRLCYVLDKLPLYNL